MKNIIEKFYLIDKKLLESYRTGDYYKTKELIKLENDEYEKTDIKIIGNLFDFLLYKLEQLNIFYDENYETALYNNDNNLINKRMFNKVNQILNRYYQNEEYIGVLRKDLYEVDSNLFLVTQNMTGAFAELEEKILTNIETKYLYFAVANNSIDNNKKTTIFMNTMFVNPYLEEKLFSPNIMIDKFIKTEDDLYYNLWKNVRDNYEIFIHEYCVNTIIDTIETMVSTTDLDENTTLRFMYLRSLFNFLDYETLDKIKQEYIKSDIETENPYGEKLVSIAFGCIERDNELIRKIKTR